MDKIQSGSHASAICKGTPKSAGKSCGAERAWYVALGGRDVMEESNQLLTNQVLMEEREVLDGMEDDGIGEDGGIE